MNRETNIDPILALDKQIAERVEDIIQLRRTRNSLLNIACVPPEILGYIFYLSVVPAIPWDGDDRFAGIQKGSYNFLLVCHHCFEVACHTPELWSSWGNRLKEWKRRYLRSGTSPLDLVLDGGEYQAETLDKTLQDALIDRVAHDAIRKVHLRSRDADLITSILSSLTPEEEGIRSSSIESIFLDGIDVFNFFTRRRFPKLRGLSLCECANLPWDHLGAHTRALVDLSLCDDAVSSTSTLITLAPTTSIPTTSQILSLLASNPDIRTLTLQLLVSDDDSRYDPSYRAPLPHLESFSLTGSIHHIFPILQRLEFPNTVDYARLILHDSTLDVVRQVVGPYIRDYLQRDARFGDDLAIFISPGVSPVSIYATVRGVGNFRSDEVPDYKLPCAIFTMRLPQHTSRQEVDKLCIDILAFLPQERVVYLETGLPTGVMEELLITMPNIEVLRLVGAVMFDWFLLPNPDGPNAHKKLLPSLRWLHLEDVETEDNDWDPLVSYLTYQTSGDHPVSLSVFGEGLHICWEVTEQIRDLVDVFHYYPDPDKGCPFDYCSG